MVFHEDTSLWIHSTKRLMNKASEVPGAASPFDPVQIGANTRKNNYINEITSRVSARETPILCDSGLQADTLSNLLVHSAVREPSVANNNPSAIHQGGVVNSGVRDGTITSLLSSSSSTTNQALGSSRGTVARPGLPTPTRRGVRTRTVREVTSGSNLDLHEESGADPLVANMVQGHGGLPDPAASGNPHTCVVCGRSFSTKSGLGVHIRRAHPDESDRINVRSDVKARWNDEEISLLACAEAELTFAGGVRFMNHALHERFVHRTVEAIKKARQKDSYKSKLQDYLSRLMAQNTEAPLDANVQAHSQLETPEPQEDSIQTFLLSLNDLDTEGYNAQELNSIVRSVIESDKDFVLHRLSGYLNGIFPPNPRARQRAVTRPPPVNMNRRKRRRHEYATTQRNFYKHCTRCIKSIIEDTGECSQPPKAIMEPYWKNIFEKTELSEPPYEDLSRQLRGNIWCPIDEACIRNTKPSLSTSPGADGITSRQIRAVPIPILVRIFNLMMWIGKVPRRLRVAKTIFIPKKKNPQLPEDFRPITLGSILIRWFHSILAKRISSSISFELSQRGFMPTDGCADNTTMIDLLLRDHHQRFASCYIAVLDVSKAFDTVSHNALYGTLTSYGMNERFIGYIRHVYSSFSIQLSGDTWESDHPILPRSGVKQGDPLSPVLFNLIIDRLIRKLPAEVGCKIGNHMTNVAAFADDLIIWASTPGGLQKLLDIVHDFLKSCGLRLNSAKCRSISIKGQPKQKRSVIVQNEFKINGVTMPALKRTEEWKYLGVTFTADGRTKVDLKDELSQKLDLLTRAPLKPQQRLFALRTVLIPQLYHVLTLGNVMIGCLNGIDRTVRSYLRKWLRLPDDAPIAFFHADVEDGGLGIISLRWQAPLIRLNRLRNLQLPLPGGTVTADTFIASEVAKVERRLDTGVVRILSKGDLKSFWANRLHESFDGRGLLHCSDHKQAHRWLKEPTRLMSGRDFIHCVKLRINALPTLSRCSRGRGTSRRCRAGCEAQETLNHVVQGCYRTKADRTKRHDSLVKYLDRNLRNKGYMTLVEGQFRTTDGIRKPDIVASKGNEIYVLDAQVVTDGRDLSSMHRCKVGKYNTLGMVRSLTDRFNATQVHFGAITLTWRGIWCRESVSDLLRWGFIERGEVAILGIRVMLGSIIAHRRFLRYTSRRTGIG